MWFSKDCIKNYITTYIQPIRLASNKLKIGATKSRLNSSVVTNVELPAILFPKLLPLTHGNKHVPPCYSLDARLVTARTVSEMLKYSARRALRWQFIAKNRKRRFVLHIALRTVNQRRQLSYCSKLHA